MCFDLTQRFEGWVDDHGVFFLPRREISIDEDVVADFNPSSADLGSWLPAFTGVDCHFFCVRGFHEDFAFSELLGNLLWSGTFTLHPRMTDDVGHEGAFVRVEVDH